MKKTNTLIILIAVLFLASTSHTQSQNALNFGGASDFVSIGDIGPVTDWTIELWFKHNGLNNYENLFHSNFSDEGAGIRLELSENWAGGNLYIYLNSVNHSILPVTGTLSSDWHHVSIVGNKSNNKILIYFDGVIKTDDDHYDWPTTFPDFVLGKGFNDAVYRYFTGTLDEFRIWNFARTEAEILSDFQSQLSGSETGLIAYYNFNEGIAGGDNLTVPVNSLPDRSNNSFNGTLNNFVLTGNTSNWVLGDYPLPVELTTFSANVNGNNILLNWETATEVNNYGFNVERKPETGDWKKITFVEGHGNSNSPKFYQFEDNSVITSGKYNYRLKQIDIDGMYEYSDIIEVDLNSPTLFELSQNYPNPFNPTTTISYSIPAVDANRNGNIVTLKVYDVIGNEIATLVNNAQAAGTYMVNFDASGLSNGIYFYTLQSDTFSETKKLILLK